MTNHPNRSRNWVLTETVCGHPTKYTVERIVARGSRQEMLEMHAKLLIERPLVKLPARRDSAASDKIIRDMIRAGTPADQIVYTRTVEHGDSPAIRALESAQ